MSMSDWKNTTSLVHKTTESDVDLNRLDFILSEPVPDHYGDVVGNPNRHPSELRSIGI